MGWVESATMVLAPMTGVSYRSALLLAMWVAGLAALLLLPANVQAQKGGLYLGAGVVGQRINVQYERDAVGSAPTGGSGDAGVEGRATDSTSQTVFGSGFLAGYRFALRPTGIYVSAEGDMTYHSGTARGAVEASGLTGGLGGLRDSWSFGEDRSYGVTARLGSGIPILGSGSGASLYVLAGLRRSQGRFRSELSGDQATPAAEGVFEETVSAWITGAGLEKRLGVIGIRGEVRYADAREASDSTSFGDLNLRVPVSLDTRGMSVRVDLLLYLF